MIFIDTRDLRYPLTKEDIIAENPTTSFPVPFEPLPSYKSVKIKSKPVFVSKTHECIPLPPKKILDEWVQDWNTVALTAAVIVERELVLQKQLAEAKISRNGYIDNSRFRINFTSFMHGGKEVSSNQLSRSDIDATNGYVAVFGVLPPGFPGGWIAIDKTLIAIPDITAWKAFYASMFAAGGANFAIAQSLKTQIAAATTVDEVVAITWPV